jgi:acetylornithine deacetylase/succinyl-diaminopimelate desuccinylase-like protein
VTTATGLQDAIAELAQFNDDPGAGGIPREVYTPTYAAALERVAAIGMIFVPSAGGISHHPDVYTAPEDLDAGVRVLAGTLARLAA